jgi:hypothetical protein
MTRKLWRVEKARFQLSLSWGEPTVKPPPWMVRRVGSLVPCGDEVEGRWLGGKKTLGGG